MEKLRNLKSYHFGMGVLIILLQIILQLSDSIYLFGVGLMIFYIYEKWIIYKLIAEKDRIEIIKEVLAQYKWVNILLILPVMLLIIKFMSDIAHRKEMLEIVYEDPLMWINMIGFNFILIHFFMTRSVKKIEREILNG